MASITSDNHRPVAENGGRTFGALREFQAFWHRFLAQVFDPYRPELHYMRGPGPACRSKLLQSPHRQSS